MKSLTQKSLGRYEIEAEIGRGAMGVVYRAFDPKIDRTVAIKTISLAGQELADEAEYRARFAQEARAAGRLSHPGIVTIYDTGEDPETHEPYLVMECINGEPLSKIIAAENGKLPLPEALRITQEIAEALDYAHSQGVIHRDIKPANILITEDGHTKITDFGVARLKQETATQTGVVVGSPAYMAPEQMTGKAADARSDLFSLGVILYSMLTGFRPFQGNSAQTVCFKVMNIEPVPVTSFQHDVPPELDAMISRAIAKDPRDRYQSGADFAREIRDFRQTDRILAESTSFFARVVQNSHATERPPTQRKSFLDSKWFWGAAAVCILSLFGWRLLRTYERPIAPPSAPSAAIAPPSDLIQLAAKKIKVRARTVKAEAPVESKPLIDPQPAPAPEPDVAKANVQVEIQHHLTGAKASIWFDDELVFDKDLRGADQRHPLLRAVEMNQVTTFQLAPGKHWLQVRVVSPAQAYDQVETIAADLEAGTSRVLLVNCDKKKMLVEFK